MAGSLYDSAPYRAALHTPETATLFTDTAQLRAMLLVLGALALAQAKAGEIPQDSADAIQRAAMEVQIDPAALAAVTAQSGDIVTALTAQFRAEIQAPEHAQYVQHGTQGQDIFDTGLALRLRQVLTQWNAGLADPSADHIRAKLDAMRPTLLCAYHTDRTTCAALAAGLGLATPGTSQALDAIARLADWITQTSIALADTTPMGQAITRQISALNTAMQRPERDTAAQLTQSLCLPQMCLGFSQLLK